MPMGELQRWLSDAKAAVAGLRKAGGQKWNAWNGVQAAGLMRDYSAACMAGDWGKLADLAGKQVASRRGDLQAMKQRQIQIADLAKHNTTLAGAAKGVKLPLKKDAAWLATRKAAAVGLDAGGKRALDDLATMTVAGLQAQLTAVVEEMTAGLDGLASNQLTALARATLAHAVARFNQHFLDGTKASGDAATTCKRIAQQLAVAERSVWTALKRGDLVAVANKASQLSNTARSALDEVLPHAAALARTRRPAPRSVTEGRLAVAIGVVLNALLRAAALGDRAAWIAGAPATLLERKRWISVANKLPFASAARESKLKPIKLLAASSTSVANGEPLTIEGAVGAMALVRDGQDDVRKAQVSDASGAFVVIATRSPFLDAGGMAPGAYVRVSGTWERATPALAIATLMRADLAKKSWSDWVTNELRITATDLAAMCSWEPGDDGAANPVEYGMGG